MRGVLVAVAGAWALLGGGAGAQSFDPEPWLEDLAQARDAMSANYANLEWAVQDRGVDLPGGWSRVEEALGRARSEAEARRLFERFLESFGDGHLRVEWPAPSAAASSGPGPAKPLCEELGFSDWGADRRAVASRLPGYTPLQTASSDVFPAGTVEVEGRKVGVLRLSLFSPDWRPDLCDKALAELKLTQTSPCDEDCRENVRRRIDARYTAALAEQLKALSATGAETLIVDLASNRGGSGWVNAAVGMITPARLRSQRLGLIRHPDFARMLHDQAEELRTAARAARGEERAMLLRYADQREAAAREAARPCDRSGLWRGERVTCSGLVKEGLYVGGVTEEPLPAAYADRPWASLLYEPVAYRFEPGLWRGGLIVLTDQYTASASEQFVAMLKGARAAVIVGAPTDGSGCGYITGSHGLAGSQTVLKNSGGKLFMPNCARFLPDGSNEVGGIEPDLLLAFRQNDTAQQKARRFAAALPAALRLAVERIPAPRP